MRRVFTAPEKRMTKIQALRQWAGAILALVAVLISIRHTNAAMEIVFALPMCIFFVCAAAYSSQKQIVALQAQIRDLRESMLAGKNSMDY